jgi:hypothetical protein
MLKRIFKIALIIAALGFFVLQFIRPDFSNPPIIGSDTLQSSTEVPKDVAQVLSRSCNDCHSNETRYPWYSKITPFNWFLADHIDVGRHELNFSEWNTYTTQKKAHKLEELCEQVEQRSMPLPSYLWIHRDASLSQGERELLCSWSKAEAARLLK